MEPPSTPSVTLTAKGGRTLMWYEAAEWQRDNKYILSGYRREKADYLEILTSLTFLHNETCNVYTHLIGALLLPLIAATVMRSLSQPQFSVVSGTDYTMFAIFFWTAECCLLFSTAFHLFGAHSHEAEQFWHRMDLLGIVIVTMGTFIPGIYYIYFCELSLQRLHWSVVILSGSSTAALICIPVFRTLRWRKVKIGAYVALGASALIPLAHGSQLYGLKYMTQYSGMNWYLLELAIYGSGTAFYALRIPERFAPGKFDIWCSSHQIFHLCILCAMYIHIFGLMQAFTACHTLDICKIQAAHKAG
ncbi:Hemolysin-III protein [Beauveria bassiana ARSEF 2860]|uniref:Hemolysin-III protein n=1 Tax=Beauveria bassiana (strain ARSEF 2860) TaxID=655819 RepID=J5K3S2_BEAB2|nr:Hemolysin-III protein [Beauveria bassiana ARSEF 2860]EJP70988.1 Hemolysin-III protein [Beauveria bassiana ARSEF 2860]